MVCIVSIKEGAHGTVAFGTDGGSLFRTRLSYLWHCASAAAVSLPDPGMDDAGSSAAAASPAAVLLGRQLPEELLEQAAQVYNAEQQALRLLARAEQHRAGLNAKLAAKKFPTAGITLALDWLEAAGLLDDQRYARFWITQRVRRHAEGPSSLSAALAQRGVGAPAVRSALQQFLSGATRREVLATAARLLDRKHPDKDGLRHALRRLGWTSADLQRYFEELE